MKNYQKLHYKHYYIMRPDGDAAECTRKECFAPPEAPTADDPFVQRWYYSPDREMAMRLPRNTEGDETYKTNAADLKKQEREQEKPNLCIGQTSTATCAVTCQNCPNSKYCDSPNRATNGISCKCKCDYCSLYKRRTFELDKPVSRTDVMCPPKTAPVSKLVINWYTDFERMGKLWQGKTIRWSRSS